MAGTLHAALAVAVGLLALGVGLAALAAWDYRCQMRADAEARLLRRLGQIRKRP